MDKAGFNSKLRATVRKGLTGQGDIDVSDVAAVLLAVVGQGRIPGRPDTRAAAKKFGVSPSTVRRWLRGGTPKPATQKALTRAARQTATTRAGRRRAVEQVRSSARAARGAKLTITGYQGKYPGGPDYSRTRTTATDLNAQDVQDLLDAYERGGDKGAVDWLEVHWDRTYVNDWMFERIDEIRWT